MSLSFWAEMGPYIVDCGGKEGKFVWLQFPGSGRRIEIGEVEVEKAADCEQVVFTEQGSTKQCLHYAAYSKQSADPEEGVTYTSAVCHTSGKVGPPGLKGPKGWERKQSKTSLSDLQVFLDISLRLASQES